MPTVVNIHEAKTHFSKILKMVAAGEQLIIARAGKPIALLSPIPDETNKTKPKREFGAARGLIWMSPDFDREDETLVKLFGA
jgi:prevent-host-death family protein